MCALNCLWHILAAQSHRGSRAMALLARRRAARCWVRSRGSLDRRLLPLFATTASIPPPWSFLRHRRSASCRRRWPCSSATAALRARYRPKSPTSSNNLNLAASISTTSQLRLRALDIIKSSGGSHSFTHAQASTLMHAHPPLQPARMGESVVGFHLTCIIVGGMGSRPNKTQRKQLSKPALREAHVTLCKGIQKKLRIVVRQARSDGGKSIFDSTR